MKALILTLTLAFAANAHSGEKLGGIMGLTLGRKFYPPSPKSECKLLQKRNDSSESCAVFIYELPPNQLYRMNTVQVSVTPKTGIVCEIVARTRTNEFATLEAATNTLNQIVALLEKKHGKAADNHIERGNQTVSWTLFKNRGERVGSNGKKEDAVTSAMIVVSCLDRELYSKAAEEREELNGATSIYESF